MLLREQTLKTVIKNRINVLNNMHQLKISPRNRENMIINLNFFRKQLQNMPG